MIEGFLEVYAQETALAFAQYRWVEGQPEQTFLYERLELSRGKQAATDVVVPDAGEQASHNAERPYVPRGRSLYFFSDPRTTPEFTYLI